MSRPELNCMMCPNLVAVGFPFSYAGCLKPGTNIVHCECTLIVPFPNVGYFECIPEWCPVRGEGHCCGKVGNVRYLHPDKLHGKGGWVGGSPKRDNVSVEELELEE